MVYIVSMATTYDWSLLFLPATVAHFGHRLGVNDVVDIVFSDMPLITPQAIRPGRRANFLVTGLFGKERVGTVPVATATQEDLLRKGAFVIDRSRFSTPAPEEMQPRTYVPLSVWPTTGSNLEAYMKHRQNKKRRARDRRSKRAEGRTLSLRIPEFRSREEEGAWWYAHRDDQFMPVKLTPTEIRYYFGDLDEDELAEIQQP